MVTQRFSANGLFYEFMSHLTRESIDYAGSDVNGAIAIEKLEKEGWEASIGYVIASCDEILSKHTAFSWHYEEDEGLEEDRVHPKRARAQLALDLGRKLQKSESPDLYSQDVLEMLKNGLGVSTRGFFGSDCYVNDVVRWGLDFLSENAPDEGIGQVIRGFEVPTKPHTWTYSDGSKGEGRVSTAMSSEKYMSTYFPSER